MKYVRTVNSVVQSPLFLLFKFVSILHKSSPHVFWQDADPQPHVEVRLFTDSINPGKNQSQGIRVCRIGIKTSQAKAGRDMSSGGFAARAQSAGDRSNNSPATKDSTSQAGTRGGGGQAYNASK